MTINAKFKPGDASASPINVSDLPDDVKEQLLYKLVFDYAEQRVSSGVWYPEGQDRDIAVNAFLAAGMDEMCQCERTSPDGQEAREAYAKLWTETDPAGWQSEAVLYACEDELNAYKKLLAFAEKAKFPESVVSQHKAMVAEARMEYKRAHSSYENHIS